MPRKRLTLLDRFYRYRSRYWRYKRLLFPSPAEMKFIELMGGKVFRLRGYRSRSTNFPVAIVLKRGKILRDARMKREVRYGKYYVDFANDLNWIIEVDGKAWHMDVVADLDREIYIKEMLRRDPYGMRILRLDAAMVFNAPSIIQRKVLKFLEV